MLQHENQGDILLMSNLLAEPEHRWLRIGQLAVGAACIAFSILIAFSPQLGTYAVLVFAGTAFMVLGAERIAAGITSKNDRKSTRVINVAIGAGILGWMLSGFFFPIAIAKYFVLFLGFGLIANDVLRIIAGLRHAESDSKKYSALISGVLSISVGVIALAFPLIGFALLLIIISVALAVSGIQLIIIALRGRKGAKHVYSESKPRAYSQPEVRGRLSPSGIWKNGTWFCDEQGRFVLFRGVNFASRSKLPPYLPIAPLEVTSLSKLELDKEIAAVREELDHLKEFGFNIVRLLISWKAIEPRPNSDSAELLPEGRNYLMSVKRIIDELYARNLYVILDFHQDIAHEVYGGDGFPDWAIAIDEDHEKPTQAGMKDKKWLLKYAVNKSVKNTLS